MSKEDYKCPSLAVDIIIDCIRSDNRSGIVLIERLNPPYGTAIPGGFVDYGESLYDAAVREAKEEVSLDVVLKRQMFAYSKPDRDPRQHVVSVVFEATAVGDPVAADDAKKVLIVPKRDLHFFRDRLVFDHYDILMDWIYNVPIRPDIENHRERVSN